MSGMNDIVNREVINKWLPDTDEGDNMASQAATAVAKIIYRWYNDGDVYDNITGIGSDNDISSYANWLYKYIPELRGTLCEVYSAYNDSEYEKVLFKIAKYFTEDVLERLSKQGKVGSVYKEDGPFEIIEADE